MINITARGDIVKLSGGKRPPIESSRDRDYIPIFYKDY
jgi:hypothetical protein